jgi:hypothetical protein
MTMTGMDMTTSDSLIPPDVMADLERAAHLVASGQRDPEFERRIHEQAAAIRQEILRTHGVLDIGVPAIRELRDAE